MPLVYVLIAVIVYMLPLLFLLSTVSAHTSSLHSQLSAQQQMLLAQQSLVSQLSRARAQLLSSNTTSDPSTSFIELVDETPLDALFSRVVPKADFEVRDR